MKKWFLLFVLFLVFAFTASAHAATYYVAQSGGSDSNSCSSAQSASGAKQTINGGLICLGAGDTLIVRSGVYDEILNNTIPSGTPGNPVTIKSETQYGAVIRPSNTGVPISIMLIDARQDIVLDGLVVDTINLAPLDLVAGIYFIGAYSGLPCLDSKSG